MHKYLLSLFLFTSIAYAAPFQWGFQKIFLKGEKQEVLKFSKELSELYLTDIGEQLINELGTKRIRYHVLKEENWSFDENAPETFITGQNQEDYQLGLFNMLSLAYTFHFGTHEDLHLQKFLEQKEQETVIEDQHPEFSFLTIKGSEKKRQKLIRVIDQILENPLGEKLFADMGACGNKLLIYDDKSSLSGGGYAGAVRSSRRIFEPGEGESAFIRFRFDQPLEGSHIVQATKGEIPFTYIDNLFHELVHAKHLMCGTFSPRAGETQAIIEENEFRRSRKETAHWPARDYHKYEDGRQVWFGLFLRKDSGLKE